jgi:hypothetical protein
MGEIGHAYKILIGKPERKRSLGRPGRRLENNIGVDLEEIGCKLVDEYTRLRMRTSGGIHTEPVQSRLPYHTVFL